jgi:hypothetical protein
MQDVTAGLRTITFVTRKVEMVVRLLRISRVSLIAACFVVAWVAATKLDFIGLILAVACGAHLVVCHLAIKLLTWGSTWN